jgi:hypothetical protein
MPLNVAMWKAFDIELLISFLLVLDLLCVYTLYALMAEPSGGHPFGHVLGIIGLLLMLMTETLYTLRKRTRWFRFGQLRLWLSFHIITGIVGPWLALLHTGFTFRGVAGLATGLTILVVISGFIGRYIYKAVPRTVNGAIVARKALNGQVVQLQAELEHWAITQSDPVQAVVAQYCATIRQDEMTTWAVLARFIHSLRAKRQLRRMLRPLEQTDRRRIQQIEHLLNRRQELDRQIASLKTAQRLLRQWRYLHIPLGLTLFTTIAIHVGATIYFGALTP